MKISDVMTTDVAVVNPATGFKEAVELLVKRNVSGLPVLDEAGSLVGVVTEADLMSKEAFGEKLRPIEAVLGFVNGDHHWSAKAAALTVGDLMTATPVTAGPQEDVRTAARRMLDRGLKRLPVVEDGRLVGIVSRHDLLALYHRDDTDIAADIAARLASPLYAPEQNTVTATVSDGVVTLTGEVRWELEVPIVAGLAGHVPGVVAVVNQVSYAKPGPR
jgi:CBS-domain-containing membrane protein